LQRSLKALLIRHGMNQPVVTLITQVQVDPSDMAFEHPSKPIGPSLSADVAVRRQRELGWCIVEDSPRRFRRAVPSPRPMAIVELEAIRACLNENMIVITAGGGGIPVVRDNGHFSGVDAVIDKDRVSALLASELGVETLLMCTDVEYVYLNFGTPQQTPFHLLHVPEAHRYLEEGEFGVGSMRPKIESALEFLSRGGREVMITDAQHLVAAMGGLTGTHVME
jgi:carbamate kinase